MFVNETKYHTIITVCAKALIASLLEYMHKKKLSQVYSELYKLLEICATIHERSHSKLKLIKTETRSTSGDERTDQLEALLVIAVEKQICNSLSLSSFVDTYARKPRKLKLSPFKHLLSLA